MERLYMFTDEPGVAEGFYRLHGPAVSRTQKQNLSLVWENGSPVEDAAGYMVDKREMLPAREIIFRRSESLLVRPRESETYFGDVDVTEDYELQQELPGAPPFDPDSRFPNRWEIEETVRYILSRNHQIAAVRFEPERRWKLTPEQRQEMFDNDIFFCPCGAGMDPEEDTMLICGIATVAYFDME